MKQFLILTLMFYSGLSFAKDAKNEWHNTTLTEEVIKKIQQSQIHYKECVVAEMQNPKYSKQESRMATDEIIKTCESELGKMRDIYIEEKVPEVIADRHLKQMRIKTTRKLLKEMMFREAARKAGQNPDGK